MNPKLSSAEMADEHRAVVERLEKALVGASVRGVEDPSVTSSVEKLTIHSIAVSEEADEFQVYEFEGAATVLLAMGSGMCQEYFQVKGIAIVLKGASAGLVYELRLPSTEPSCFGVGLSQTIST